MVDVKRFVLHVVKLNDQDQIVKSKEIPITPKDNENVMRMKQDVALKLKRERDRDVWSYWYVVCEIDGGNAGTLHRTVVGKTFFK